VLPHIRQQVLQFFRRQPGWSASTLLQIQYVSLGSGCRNPTAANVFLDAQTKVRQMLTKDIMDRKRSAGQILNFPFQIWQCE
jgi:hypothetical protein